MSLPACLQNARQPSTSTRWTAASTSPSTSPSSHPAISSTSSATIRITAGQSPSHLDPDGVKYTCVQGKDCVLGGDVLDSETTDNQAEKVLALNRLRCKFIAIWWWPVLRIRIRDPESGIRFLFDPWILNRFFLYPWSRILDSGSPNIFLRV